MTSVMTSRHDSRHDVKPFLLELEQRFDKTATFLTLFKMQQSFVDLLYTLFFLIVKK